MNIKEKFLIIGHRGANSVAPENTLKAFQKAIDMGADFIEIDIQESKDGQLVITHDEDLDRLTGKQGFVKDYTLSELRTLDFGEGESIPTLQEVIELTNGRIELNCEIKVKDISNKVVDIIKNYKVINTVVISSFLHEELLKLKKMEPTLRLASLEPTEFLKNFNDERKKEMIKFCINNDLYAINPFYSLVDQGFVDFAHDNNLKVFPWTVDSKPMMRKLIRLGVDGIITNDILKLKKILSQIS
jgi:glycerophosphoryl diester phosphodiesterase